MITITKKALVRKVSKNPFLKTKDKVEIIFDTITLELEKGNRIEIRGFGVFEVKRRGARTCKNPRTGESVEVPARNVVIFKPSKKMKTNIRG